MFASLRLRGTSLVGTPEAVSRLALGYSQLWVPGAPPRNVATDYHLGWVAHELVASTAGELVRLVAAICSGLLVPNGCPTW